MSGKNKYREIADNANSGELYIPKYGRKALREAASEIERLEKEVADLVHDLVRKDKALLEYEELHK